jgi:hypothetical protein
MVAGSNLMESSPGIEPTGAWLDDVNQYCIGFTQGFKRA